MQGQQDATSFITSFTGSHQYVVDYLLEEVLGRQSERDQTFLLPSLALRPGCIPLMPTSFLQAIPPNELGS
jgi:ATP/maltotriose-dependent transcriptional regulator MalT